MSTRNRRRLLDAMPSFLGAIEAYTAAATLSPRDHVALDWIGYLHLHADRPAEAVAPLRRAVELKADYLQAQRNLSEALARSGDPRGAAESRLTVVRLDLGDWEASKNAVIDVMWARQLPRAQAVLQALLLDEARKLIMTDAEKAPPP